jgi:hypothetical protein
MTPTPADLARIPRPKLTFTPPQRPEPPPPAPVRSDSPRRPAALAQPGVHDCPGYECAALVSPGLVACRACWLTVPKSLRAELIPAFLARTSDPDGYAAAVTRTTDLVRLHTRRAHR